jgi:hypothetical protein
MDELKMVSAYHNYLVRGRLQREVVLKSRGGFFFHAHRVEPMERVPSISGRFFDRRGELLLVIQRNELVENPQGLALIPMGDGWSLISSTMEAILSCQVVDAKEGLITILRGVLHDERGQEVLKGGELGLEFPPELEVSELAEREFRSGEADREARPCGGSENGVGL